MAPNPYLNRSMIRSVAEFCGRRVEVQRVIERLGAQPPQSVSLVGERRMGKSSLLWHISQPQIHGHLSNSGRRYLFVFIDFERYPQLDQAGFCQILERHLSEAAGDSLQLPEPGGPSRLEQMAEAVARSGMCLVCLFDEFEAVTRNPAFSADFFGTLRSLANAYPLAYVTASRRPLETLCHSHEISQSPFFNIFSEVRLGAMPPAEVRQLIAASSASAGLPLEPHADRILDLGGHLPFFVQIACAAVFEDLAQAADRDTDGPDWQAVERTFLSEASSHFHYLYERFADPERRVVAALATGGQIASQDAAWLRSLESQGYVVQSEGSGPRLFSRVFASFLRQTLESSLPASVGRPSLLRVRPAYLWLLVVAASAIGGLVWHQSAQDSTVPGGDSASRAPEAIRGRSLPQAPVASTPLQPVSGGVRLSVLEAQDLFASFHQSHADHPVASVAVTNDEPDSLRARLSLQVPGYTGRPAEQAVLLGPHSTQAFDLAIRLDPELLALQDAQRVEARAELSFLRGGETIALSDAKDLTLHGLGALRWDSVKREGAFITPTDAAVAAFARPLMVDFEPEIEQLGTPCRNPVRAMILFEAIKAHGVRYMPDPNTPYGQVRADAAAIDHVQYPAQLLHSKAGDCDDLTALFCSLLENAGVSTALVDAPGHIFLLFDSGLSRPEMDLLPFEERLYLRRGDRLWLPLEVTLIDQSFAQAWRAGAEAMTRLSRLDLGLRVMETAQAWQAYPPAAPDFGLTITAPPRPALEAAVTAQRTQLRQAVDVYVEKAFLYPLQAEPTNEALRRQLIRTYLALRQYDTAIAAALDHLLDEQGDKARTYNQLGIAYSLKDDLRQAALYFKQAAELRPEDTGIRRNLDRALEALGRAAPAGAETAAQQTDATGPKAASMALSVDSFYWIE